MSPERIIPAEEAARKQIESFPYFAATYVAVDPLAEAESDEPIGDRLSTPEEDARRLASVDQQIFEKLQAAEREAQEIARRAYEEGFAAGEEEGRAFGESQYTVYLQRLDADLAELARVASLVEKAAQDELLALALSMAEYLAAQQLDRSAASIQPLLEAILSEHPFPSSDPGNPAAEFMVARLNPRDLEALGDRYGAYPGLRLVSDEELSRGSLRLETAEGVLEATLERRRERLMDLLHRFKEQDT